ncbi:MAG TPA: GlsB/YeaQ/YmgE family stress response membrane protein [Thiolinea sp.]|nr:GlsB/YeaQ/YmgE family stress response membrane protein [Thiolinea sp.]
MGVVEILIMLAIGAVAGWLAGNFIRGGGFGLIGNIVVGLIGSVVGTFLGGMVSGAFGWNIPGIVGSIIWATLGAMLLLFIVSLFKRV